MNLMVYSYNTKKLHLADKIEERFGTEIDYVSEIPDDLGVGNLLVLDIDDAPNDFKDEVIEELRYTNANFVYVVSNFLDKKNSRIIHIGGELFTFKSLSDRDFIEVLYNRLNLLEVYKLFSLLGRADMDLFRAISRAGNGEREKISWQLYGSSSENTIDVNLSRLRKKLRDPEIGNDFFRIITKQRRFYLVSQLSGYQIDEDLIK